MNSSQRSSLKIGGSTGKPFTLPVDVIGQTIAILGIRGSGKTNTGSVIVEELLERGHHLVVVDPLDVWWGLKSSADGKRAGYPVVVLGGAHGDLPLQEGDGEVLADFAVEERVPLVLSLRHLRKGAQRRFVTDFAERLYHRKGETQHRVPLLLVIDEADAFVPQRVGANEARMVGSIEDLVRRGRAAGIGVTLISQRAASVNKDVLTQLELLVAHRHTSPQDRKALQEWVRAHDTEGLEEDFFGQLAGLPVGTAWFWSPGWLDVFQRVEVRLRSTFDSSKTPKPGDVAESPKKLAEVDLQAIRGRLTETIQEARANDPKELKRRIAELDAELRKAAKSAEPDPRAIARIVKGATAPLEEELAALRAAAEQLSARIHQGRDVAEQLVQVLRNGDVPAPTEKPDETWDITPQGREVLESVRPSKRSDERPRQKRTIPAGITSRATAPSPASTGDLPKGEHAILTAICQYPDGVDRAQLSILTGYKRSSRDTYLQRLSAKGLVDVRGSLIVPASGAEKHLGDFERLPTGIELQDYWLGRLPAGEAAILRVLLEEPDGLTRDEISMQTEYKRSSRDTYIQRLRARKLVDVDGPHVLAAELLFE